MAIPAARGFVMQADTAAREPSSPFNDVLQQLSGAGFGEEVVVYGTVEFDHGNVRPQMRSQRGEQRLVRLGVMEGPTRSADETVAA